VKHISDRIAIMYLGKIVESGEGESIYRTARHPYTQSLISAIPVPDPHHKSHRQVLVGDVPSPINPPSGCAFHTRCPQVMDICRSATPVLSADRQPVSCHLYNT
jgi:oligopeptide/dipeptide ABC transporter ATP-binding protein